MLFEFAEALMGARFFVEAQATEQFDDPLLMRDGHLVERLAARGRQRDRPGPDQEAYVLTAAGLSPLPGR